LNVLDFGGWEAALSANPSARTIRFSTFEVNLQTGELHQRGQKVRLQEQPFQLLAALLERPGDVVTREELRNKLWPADTFVDFDHSLNAAIKRLRVALGESAEKPVFVETVARRGYRFIAPVDGGSSASAIGITAASEQNKSFFATHWLITVCLALMVVSIVAWTAWRPSRPGELIERKLTSNSSENSVSSAAISPDRKYIAYADNSGFYLKQIRTGEAHPLPLPPNFSARVDDWFPDGSHLLVSREEQPGKASLWSISIFGGSPRQLADDASGGSVSPDGSHIAFRRGALTYDGLWGREEWVMRSDGTDPVKVAADNSDGSEVGAPTWSPDGKRIAYLRSSWAYNMSTNSIEVNEWQNARAEILISDRRLIIALRWLPDGRLIYALAGHSSLWTVALPRTGKVPEPPRHIATTEHGSISRITGSADGKALIFLRANSLPSIYIGTLTEDGTKLLAHTRLTLDESVSLAWSWTPDSKAVLLFSDRNGTSEMFKHTADQPLAESLVVSAGQLSAFRVTPDGSEILYISTPRSASPETPSSIFAIPTNGGTPRLVLRDARIWNLQCARLPSRLCLYSVTKGNTVETYRFDVKSGKSTDPPQIDSPIDWSLSPDGSQLAVIVRHPNQGTIQLRDTSTSKTRDLVVEGWNGLMGADWSADGKSIFTTSHSHEGDSTLLNVTLDGRASVLLHSRNEVYSAIPSPDGRSLAITEDSGAKNVWQIENF
jgi:DNA-binding winged helix-turn-helix (wHTH) protein/Tol biopolymer transport system component